MGGDRPADDMSEMEAPPVVEGKRISKSAVVDESKMASDLAMYETSSVENFYHYVRFVGFKSATDAQKKELIKILTRVPCRQHEVLSQLLAFATSDDIDGALAFAPKYALNIEETLASLTTDEIRPVIAKDMNEMIDVYFEESDEEMSLRVLRDLMFFTVVDDGTIYRDYINRLRTMSFEDRKVCIPVVQYSSYII